MNCCCIYGITSSFPTVIVTVHDTDTNDVLDLDIGFTVTCAIGYASTPLYVANKYNSLNVYADEDSSIA
jgi:hypothetical protein